MLVARQIALLPRYLYAAPAYLKKAPALRDPHDLAQHVLCMVQNSRQQTEKKTFYRADEVVEVLAPTRFVMNSVGLSRSLAKQGAGIAVLDSVLAREDVAAGLLRRVLPDWNMASVAVHAITETRLLPARARLFIDFLKARLQQHGSADPSAGAA